MGRFEVGGIGQQPQGQVLLDHRSWSETARERDRYWQRMSSAIERFLGSLEDGPLGQEA
jgi:hypothetical protein